eukprot:1604631-Rhodomonas_salina.3
MERHAFSNLKISSALISARTSSTVEKKALTMVPATSGKSTKRHRKQKMMKKARVSASPGVTPCAASEPSSGTHQSHSTRR